MNGAVLLVAAGVTFFGARYLGRGGARPSWAMPQEQEYLTHRLDEAAGLYRNGRPDQAGVVLRNLDWDLVADAARDHREPLARRLGRVLDERGAGVLMYDLDRTDADERDLALQALVVAVTDYTGPR